MIEIITAFLLAIYTTFCSPVHSDISLAGNFGEPRPNHFHGGLDIKTDGVEGRPIFAIADGYVSHITIGLSGFGNAVYIHHPNGYTSIYCHLQGFSPLLTAIARKWQYRHKSFRADIRLSPTDVPVARGQLIAVSGNTGASQAPHLHLEIHDTRTGNMHDPYRFLHPYIADSLAPMAHGLMAYPIEEQGKFCGSSQKQSFPLISHHLDKAFHAWGKIGFGIWANDYMESTYNRYGVKKTELYVDGHLVFCSDVDMIPAEANMAVNSWGDYEHYLRYGVWYMKSFVDPGIATFPIFKTSVNGGIIDFNEERAYELLYVLTDYKGNSSRYGFTVQGKKEDFQPLRNKAPRPILRWDRFRILQLPGMQMAIGRGYLADHLQIRPQIRIQPDRLSDSYSLTERSAPMLRYGTISIQLRKKVKDPSKLYIASDAGYARYMGGEYRNGWVTGAVRELAATYQIAYDDQPPVITPVRQSSWNSDRTITLGLSDAGSGIAQYEGYIDGQFVLFEDVPKSSWIKCRLQDTPVKRKQTRRQLKVIAKDQRNNIQVYQTFIHY